MISSIPNYFNNFETPIICYKYNKPIRSTIFNVNIIVTDIDIDSNAPGSWDCINSNYLYPSAGHVITCNINVIPDARVRNIISKGPKYRFPANIDFPKCRREIATSLNDSTLSLPSTSKNEYHSAKHVSWAPEYWGYMGSTQSISRTIQPITVTFSQNVANI